MLERKSADNELADLVDEDYESEDSYADMPSLVHQSNSRMSDSSSDSDYETEFDVDNYDSVGENVSSLSNSEDNLDDNKGYKSEDSCTGMPQLICPNQRFINAMKELDASYNPIRRKIPESQEPVRPVVDENTEGSNTGTT